MLVREGGVEIEVPEARDGASEGSGEGVFFNPTQELNRDVTVAVLRAFREREPRAETYLDAMTASGVRGVRAAAARYDVTCADVDPDAVALAESNLARNDLDGRVVHRDANALLHEADFDVVDVDPFGSPVPFADAAFASARGLVAVTATDTAPLCGAHMNAGVRKYDAVPRNTEYHPEMGLRVLVSAMVRTAARRDVAATPVFSHVTRHYARTYLEIERKATAADAVLEDLGFVYHCPECLAREHEHGRIADQPDTCPECGSDQVLTAGPIWLGPVVDRKFVDRVADHVTDDMGEARQARKLATSIRAELDVPTHYDQHRLCKRWGRPASSMDAFLDALRDAGFDASRAHYSGTAFKTDAGVAQIREATREID